MAVAAWGHRLAVFTRDVITFFYFVASFVNKQKLSLSVGRFAAVGHNQIIICRADGRVSAGLDFADFCVACAVIVYHGKTHFRFVAGHRAISQKVLPVRVPAPMNTGAIVA